MSLTVRRNTKLQDKQAIVRWLRQRATTLRRRRDPVATGYDIAADRVESGQLGWALGLVSEHYQRARTILERRTRGRWLRLTRRG